MAPALALRSIDHADRTFQPAYGQIRGQLGIRAPIRQRTLMASVPEYPFPAVGARREYRLDPWPCAPFVRCHNMPPISRESNQRSLICEFCPAELTDIELAAFAYCRRVGVD